MTKLEKNKIMKAIEESLIKQRDDEITQILSETELGDDLEFNGEKAIEIDAYDQIMSHRRIRAIYEISAKIKIYENTIRFYREEMKNII